VNIEKGKWYLMICESGEKFVGLAHEVDERHLTVLTPMQIFTEAMRLTSPAGLKTWTAQRVLPLEPAEAEKHQIPLSRLLRIAGPVPVEYVHKLADLRDATVKKEEEDRSYAEKNLQMQQAMFERMRAAQESGIALPGMPGMPGMPGIDEDPRRRRS
jgi:hypothetical protein